MPFATSDVKTSRSGGDTSMYLPLDHMSWPSGERMQIAQVPPERKSISASGTVKPSGLNHRFICSAVLHALKTSRRGATNVREMTSGFVSRLALLLLACAMFTLLLFQFFEMVAKPIEPLLPFGAASADPCFG